MTILAIAILIGGLWYQLIQMIHVPFHDWDESIYAQVALSWSRHPSLTPMYNGSIWLEKPVMVPALVGSLFTIFGVSEFIARLPSLIAGIGCALLTLLVTYRLTRRVSLSLLAMGLTAQTSYFLDRSSLLNVDIYLTLAWLLYVSSANSRVRAVSTVIGVGAKSVLGYIPLLCDMAILIVQRQYTRRRALQDLAIVLVAAWWHIIMYLQHGQAFIQSHFQDHLISRVTTAIELHFGGRLYYLERLWENLPLTILITLCGYIIWQVKLVRHRRLQHVDLIFIIPAAYLLLLTIARAKLHWYTTPLIPAASIVAAYAVSHIPRRHIRLTLTALLMSVTLVLYVQRTYLIDLSTYQAPPSVQLARCKQYIYAQGPIAYLVSPGERRDAQVIEAAKLQIGSSFIYGGAPSFTFYVDSPVRFYYSREQYIRDLVRYTRYVYHRDDAADVKAEIERLSEIDGRQTIACTRDAWTMSARME